MRFSIIVVLLLSLFCFTNCTDEKTSASKGDTEQSTLETGWYHVVEEGTSGAVKRQLDMEDKFYHLDPVPGITIKHIREAYIYSGMTQEEGVRMPLTDEGRKLWESVTQRAQRKYMGFVVDDQLIIVQRIPGVDRAGETVFFKKQYDKEKLEAISNQLNQKIKELQN